jgi:hypothetical protein
VHLGHFPKNLRKIDRKRRLDITGKLLILDPASAKGPLLPALNALSVHYAFAAQNLEYCHSDNL